MTINYSIKTHFQRMEADNDYFSPNMAKHEYHYREEILELRIAISNLEFALDQAQFAFKLEKNAFETYKRTLTELLK